MAWAVASSTGNPIKPKKPRHPAQHPRTIALSRNAVDLIANDGADGAHLDELADEELPPAACRVGGGRGRRLAPPLSSRPARHCGGGSEDGRDRVQWESEWFSAAALDWYPAIRGRGAQEKPMEAEGVEPYSSIGRGEEVSSWEAVAFVMGYYYGLINVAIKSSDLVVLGLFHLICPIIFKNGQVRFVVFSRGICAALCVLLVVFILFINKKCFPLLFE